MELDFKSLALKWQKNWIDTQAYKVEIQPGKPKYYVLDMFPYPSGAGLHVGHPLGYIASDIVARYKRMNGFNVLHPMGYDSFGLPAEQYAIQTGQHPAKTTEQNVKRYREQMDQLGFSFDWSRSVQTSDPGYYKWTQWIFKRFFNAYYDTKLLKARDISDLISEFESEGNVNVEAYTEYNEFFTATDWKAFSASDKENILQHYRLAYLSDVWVNWCPTLGTVLANDEVVNGTSVRGGHPVEQKKMRQWSMRIKAYAERLLEGLNNIDWSDSIKDQQKNWIGKSEGALISFEMAEANLPAIQVFSTRPDTIFGVSFLVLAPENPIVEILTAPECKASVLQYQKEVSLKSERERLTEIKNQTGVFTGAYVIHPFSKEKVPVWIGDYVLANYGTGAVMAVPAGDQRDYDFAMKFNLPIPSIFKNCDLTQGAVVDKKAILCNASFLDGLTYAEATPKVLDALEKIGQGIRKINYRLRDAVFSRQRYWGEPFPVYYDQEIPRLVEDRDLPVELPKIDAFLPTEEGEPPLARAQKTDWNVHLGDRMEFNTMPGWAGSSWYFLRYLDPKCEEGLASKESMDYWKNVDLYIGGNEHATGHLLYARFWTKFLCDLGIVPFDEPFKKLINQGMILGRSSYVYRLKAKNTFVSHGLKEAHECFPVHVDIALVENDLLNLEGFKNWLPEYKNAEFILEPNGTYVCGYEVEKMSKSKFNVQTPDELVEKYGADTLRMYEMFLGPIEQSKPWDIKGITGVHGFLKKFWRLYHSNGVFGLSEETPTSEEWRVLHKTIKKVREDIDRFSLNTVVSSMMIAVNELTDLKCNKKQILTDLNLLLAPYAPYITAEIWEKIAGKNTLINDAKFPEFDESYLVESTFSYPISFNGKMRFTVELDLSLDINEIEKLILNMEETKKWLDGKFPKKMIIVPGRIVNVVI